MCPAEVMRLTTGMEWGTPTPDAASGLRSPYSSGAYQ